MGVLSCSGMLKIKSIALNAPTVLRTKIYATSAQPTGGKAKRKHKIFKDLYLPSIMSASAACAHKVFREFYAKIDYNLHPFHPASYFVHLLVCVYQSLVLFAIICLLCFHNFNAFPRKLLYFL